MIEQKELVNDYCTQAMNHAFNGMEDGKELITLDFPFDAGDAEEVQLELYKVLMQWNIMYDCFVVDGDKLEIYLQEKK